MTNDQELLTALNAAEHACIALDDIIDTAVSVTIYRLANAAAHMLTIAMAKLPEFNAAGTNIVSKLGEISDQLRNAEYRIEIRFNNAAGGLDADPYVFLATAVCRQAAERLAQAAHEVEEPPKAPDCGGVAAGATANDNEKFEGRSNSWMQGRADGQKGAWSEHLADEEDPVGGDYLSGWMLGNKEAKRA